MILRKQIKYPIERWKNVLKGHPAFILGNGPSIVEHDLSLLDNYFTIGINRINMLLDPIVLLWQDRGLYDNNGREEFVESSSAIQICRTNIDKEGRYTNFILESNPYKFHYQPDHLWGFGCSGGLAVQLGVAMGASHIVLLGTDCDYDDPEKTDFYGKNDEHRPHTVRNFHRAMRWVQRDCPIPVFNCSKARYWPKTTLPEAIRQINPKKVSRVQWLAKLRVESAGDTR